MNNYDENKVRVITDVVMESLEIKECYRIACNLSEDELSQLKTVFNINIIEEFDTTALYLFKKRS